MKKKLVAIREEIKAVFISTDSVERFFSSPKIVFLLFHSTPSEHIQKIDEFIKYLKTYADFISYSEAIQKIKASVIDKSYVVFTTDDGFKNNENLLGLYEKYGINGMFFINPFIVKNQDAQSKEHFSKQLRKSVTEYFNSGDIKRLIEYGHEVGSHTYEHWQLSKLSMDELASDFKKVNEFEQEMNIHFNHIAWGYGKQCHISKDAANCMIENGFESYASTIRGFHDNTDKTNLIKRHSVDGSWSVKRMLNMMMSKNHEDEYLMTKRLFDKDKFD